MLTDAGRGYLAPAGGEGYRYEFRRLHNGAQWHVWRVRIGAETALYGSQTMCSIGNTRPVEAYTQRRHGDKALSVFMLCSYCFNNARALERQREREREARHDPGGTQNRD